MLKLRETRLAMESLQKEITDRQMLIESQNEKICELNRELAALRTRSGPSVDAVRPCSFPSLRDLGLRT